MSVHIIVCHLHSIDIDECVEDLSGCSDICQNTNGSFECSCHNGYYLSHDDNRTCIGTL